MKYVNLSELNGKVIKYITGLEQGSEEVHIFTECGKEYLFYHEQDCCENVSLDDFEGNAYDLEGALILSAEEVEGISGYEDSYESCTWTFYKIETSKGGVWMRWLGASNGYYSESVDFALIKDTGESCE